MGQPRWYCGHRSWPHLPQKIGGIVSVSGWCTYRETLSSKVPGAKSAVPCLFCCSSKDDVIDVKLSRKSEEVLKPILGENLTYAESNRAGHFQSPAEMTAIESFMVEC